jgi:hypothetical protein
MVSGRLDTGNESKVTFDDVAIFEGAWLARGPLGPSLETDLRGAMTVLGIWIDGMQHQVVSDLKAESDVDLFTNASNRS